MSIATKSKDRLTTQYKEMECKSALNKIRTPQFSFGYSLNVYRGCIHRCPYCYARYTHQYLGYEGENDFYNKIHVKTNIAEVLEKELTKKGWRGDIVSLGTATDPYQPAEKKYGLVRKCLSLFAEHNVPVIFSTKSDLVERDIDLLSEINRATFCGVALTITTLDDKLRRIVEPYATSVMRRIRVLDKLKRSGIKTGIHVLPIIKYLTDSPRSISRIVELASEVDADYFIYGGMNISSPLMRKSFLDMLRKYNPAIYFKYKCEIKSGTLYNKEYLEKLTRTVEKEKHRYHYNPASLGDIIRKAYISLRTMDERKARQRQDLQLSLF